MKMKSVLIASAMMAIGVSGVAFAGNGAPHPTVECNDDPYETCIGEDLVEVELKCTDEYEGGIWLGDDLVDLLAYEKWELDIDWALGVQDDGYVCGALGWHDLLKTEGKCTEQAKGPTNPKSKSKHKGTAVKYKIKTIDVGGCEDL